MSLTITTKSGVCSGVAVSVTVKMKGVPNANVTPKQFNVVSWSTVFVLDYVRDGKFLAANSPLFIPMKHILKYGERASLIVKVLPSF